MRNEIEVMKVWRMPPMGKLAVEVGGRRLESLAELQNEATEQRILAAIGELITFAGGYKRLVDAGVAPELIPPAPPAAATPPPAASAQETQAKFLASLMQKSAEPPAAPPSPLSFGFRRPTKSIPPAGALLSQVNIVDQIDTILQRLVAADPELAARDIRMEPGPGGKLQIRVDGKNYQRPAEIEDKAVQKVLKQALVEWERS